MRIRLFTFRYSATLGGFDDEPLQQFIRDKEVLAFREHFFCIHEVPHLACVLVWQDALVAPSLTRRGAASPESDDRRRRRDRSEPRADPTEQLDESQRALFNSLREWRAAKAHAEGVPPYVVFTNRHLVAIVQRRPESANALAALEGIGAGKVERYGKDVLCLVAPAPAANGKGA